MCLYCIYHRLCSYNFIGEEKMKRAFTLDDLKQSAVAHLNAHLFDSATQQPAKKKSKYNNKKIEIDGHTFDSLAEGRRYVVLRGKNIAGEITDLQMQVPFPLSTGKYIADFTYYDHNGNYIVEDTKGFKTKEYKMKKSLMLTELNITITETK